VACVFPYRSTGPIPPESALTVLRSNINPQRASCSSSIGSRRSNCDRICPSAPHAQGVHSVVCSSTSEISQLQTDLSARTRTRVGTQIHKLACFYASCRIPAAFFVASQEMGRGNRPPGSTSVDRAVETGQQEENGRQVQLVLLPRGIFGPISPIGSVRLFCAVILLLLFQSLVLRVH
jgi:hypothetical protein